MSAKATLGYSSRTEAVQALRKQGLTSAAIAARVGIEVKTVTALEASAQRKSPERSISQSTIKQHTVCVDNDILRALRPHAARRGLSVNQLCRQLLGAIADDDMVDAVLDDAR